MDVELLVVKAFVTLFVALLIGFGYCVYDEAHSEKFYLRKDQWTCTETKRHVVMQYNPATKMTLPQTYTECVNWRRK